MPSSYSTSLRLELQATGENRNSWGTKNNTNLSLIESAIAGFQPIDMDNNDITLTTSNGANDQARKMMVYLYGTNSAVKSVTIPTVSKVYILINATTGGYAVTITNGTSNVSVGNGETSMVYTDGTTVWKVPYLSYEAQLLSATQQNQVMTNLGFAWTGAVGFFAASTVPTGWLECDGSAVSRTTYAPLFAYLGTTWGSGNGSTTFNVPDFRGEFLRGWDHGKGTDSGRTFGSHQDADNAAHTHTGTTASNGAHSHTTSSDGSHAHSSGNGAGFNLVSLKADSGSPYGYQAGGDSLNTASTTSTNGLHSHTTNSTGAHTHTITTDSQGSEARPRNFALLPCIKT